MLDAEHGAGPQLADRDHLDGEVRTIGPVADVLGHLVFTVIEDES